MPTPDPTPDETPEPTPTPTPTQSPTPVPSPSPIVGQGSSNGPVTPGGSASLDRTGGQTPGLPTGSGPVDLGRVLNSVADAAVDQAAIIVKPAAAAAVASSFAFPLILMLAVLFFLVVQPRIDGRDPKLRKAPRSAGETLVQFEEEGAL